ncbi:MAG: hypothetical protein PQJ58_11550, partial [Spirochaetales bacterium]|nr:hypothetical protein [Spirochaetales bacterium]
SPEYKEKPGAVQSRIKRMNDCFSGKDKIRLIKTFATIMPSMKRNINRNFSDMKPYLKGQNNPAGKTRTPVIDSVKKAEIWEDLKRYAWDNHRAVPGFTRLPEEYVFKNKAVPFRYALVFIQEMDKSAIEKAPEIDAGMEVIKVYNSLGIATNDIARWLRDKYGINCMANHPLGGLVDTVPLARNAGLGAIGRNGLLITREFGPRCRISPIFLEEELFDYTDSDRHDWVENFCARCGSCARSCPVSCIYDTPRTTLKYEGLKDRCENYDREKCFTSFSATMGCAVCISVCPFSKKPENYDKLKNKYIS